MSGTEDRRPGNSTTAWIRARFREALKSQPQALPQAEPVPDRIGAYRVRRRIGRGSIANVYQAEDGRGDTVAIKVIRPDQAGPDAEAVFRREADILGRLRHPDIVAFREIGRHGAGLHIVMDYVEGPTLQFLIDEGAPREDLVPMLARVARAVDHAHRHGVIHRDLKPQNILIGDAGPVVTDFGIARARDAVTLTKGAQPIGTPTHMAPEQVDRRRAPIGPATDVWAMGVTLYQILCRRLPFHDADTTALYARILNDLPRAMHGSVPGALEDACLKALEKRPEARHASAAAFAEAISASGSPSRPLSGLRRWIRRLWRRA